MGVEAQLLGLALAQAQALLEQQLQAQALAQARLRVPLQEQAHPYFQQLPFRLLPKVQFERGWGT